MAVQFSLTRMFAAVTSFAVIATLVVTVATSPSAFANTPTASSAPATKVATMSAEPSASLSQFAPDGAQLSTVMTAPFSFTALGFRAPLATTGLEVRTAKDVGVFGSWQEIDFYGEENGPDPGQSEDAARSHQHAEMLWTGEAKYLQLRVTGASLDAIDVVVIDSMGVSSSVPVGLASDGQLVHDPNLAATPFQPEIHMITAATGNVGVISRAEWGADESLGSPEVDLADTIHMGIVHHTAHRTAANGANTYTLEEAPGIIRALHIYHTRPTGEGGLGWKDIGYNILIDRFGRVYEGRRGGFDQPVIGAHARGFNTGSFGVSVIGDFSDELPSQEAIAALTDVIGMKAQIHGLDPDGFTTDMPVVQAEDDAATASLANTGVLRPVIVGHRDVGATLCPGTILDLLPNIRLAARGIAVRFPDVPASSPHRPSIVRLAEQGVIRGCRENAFCPSQGLTRAQAATFVVQALQLPVVQPTGTPFTDVPLEAPHASSIYTLVENGFMVGKRNNRFGPSDRMTRAQLATLLYNASGHAPVRPTTDPYPDVTADQVHATGIAGLKNLGIVGNCGGGNFCPTTVVLRDSTASFVDMLRTVTGRNATVAVAPFVAP